jgi:hypothetical protein
VLFSLSALTSAAQSRPSTRPSSSSNGSSRDDSGLIDLKALTAAAMKSEVTGGPPAVAAMPQVAPLSPLGVAPPLGMASPLGQMSAGGFDYGDVAPFKLGAELGGAQVVVLGHDVHDPEWPVPPHAFSPYTYAGYLAHATGHRQAWEEANRLAQKEGAVNSVRDWFEIRDNQRLLYYVAIRGWRPVEKADEAAAADILRGRPHLRGPLHYYVDSETYLEIQKAKQGMLLELMKKMELDLKRM